MSDQVSSVDWEEVGGTPGHDETRHRLRLVGGWLYAVTCSVHTHTGYEDVTRGMAFVPDHQQPVLCDAPSVRKGMSCSRPAGHAGRHTWSGSREEKR